MIVYLCIAPAGSNHRVSGFTLYACPVSLRQHPVRRLGCVRRARMGSRDRGVRLVRSLPHSLPIIRTNPHHELGPMALNVLRTGCSGSHIGFRSAKSVCSRLQFVQTNISLCFPKVRSAGSISLSRNSPPHCNATRAEVRRGDALASFTASEQENRNFLNVNEVHRFPYFRKK